MYLKDRTVIITLKLIGDEHEGKEIQTKLRGSASVV